MAVNPVNPFSNCDLSCLFVPELTFYELQSPVKLSHIELAVIEHLLKSNPTTQLVWLGGVYVSSSSDSLRQSTLFPVGISDMIQLVTFVFKEETCFSHISAEMVHLCDGNFHSAHFILSPKLHFFGNFGQDWSQLYFVQIEECKHWAVLAAKWMTTKWRASVWLLDVCWFDSMLTTNGAILR